MFWKNLGVLRPFPSLTTVFMTRVASSIVLQKADAPVVLYVQHESVLVCL